MLRHARHGIAGNRTREEIVNKSSILDIRGKKKFYEGPEEPSLAAGPIITYMGRDQVEKSIADTERKMRKAAKELDFISAAQYRDELFALKKKLKEAV